MIVLTIKRRLLISNILMVILPVFLTWTAISVLYVTFLDRNMVQPNQLPVISSDLFSLGFDDLEIDVQDVMEQLGTSYLLVIPDDLSSYLIEAYAMLVPLSQQERLLMAHPYLLFFMMLLFVAAFIFLINHMLIKFVFKPIRISLDALAYGVQEISDGNLDYKIEQNLGNEFDDICTNFNEMAAHLFELVKQRQADEKSRKVLIAGISHDLRTPLTSIKAYLEGVRKGVASTVHMREKYFDTIQCKIEDMAYMIDQLFLFSKLDIGEFPLTLKSVEIGNELSHLVSEIGDEYKEKGFHLLLKENVEQTFVLLDVAQFRNMIQNILNNSVKYGKKENDPIEIHCYKQHEGVVIRIFDNGPGVPEDLLARIFDVFYRCDTSRNSAIKGSGLGLAICSKIVERLNGKIEAENVVGGGFSVIITLPLDKKGEEYEKNIDC